MDGTFIFQTQEQARNAAAALINDGFEASTHRESGWVPHAESAGSARVEVTGNRQKEALHFVKERAERGDPVFTAAWRCPECGGFHVEYPQFPRKHLLPNLTMELLAAGRLVEKMSYCHDCHATWKPAPASVHPPAKAREPAPSTEGVAL